MAGKFDLLLTAGKVAPPKKPVMGPVEEETPHRERVVAVAEDLLSAVKGGDVEAVADALIAAHHACSDYSSDEE